MAQLTPEKPVLQKHTPLVGLQVPPFKHVVPQGFESILAHTIF